MPHGSRISSPSLSLKLYVIPCLLYFVIFSISVSFNLPVWGDVYFTHKVSLLPLKDCINAVLKDVHPPLFWIITNFLYSLSQDLLIVKIFSLLCGFGILYIVLKFLNQINAKYQMDNVFIIFTILFCTSSFILLFIPMARYYSFMTLLVASSLLLRYEVTGNWLSVAYIVIIDTLLLYTNFLSGLFLLGNNIFLLLHKRNQLKSGKLLVIWIIPWVLFSPVINYLFQTISRLSMQDFFNADFSAGLTGFLVRMFYSFHVFLSGEFVYPWQVSSITILIVVVYLLYRFLNYAPNLLKSLLGWGIFFPLILTVVGSITIFSLGMEFLPSRLAFAQPFLLISLAIGLETVVSKRFKIFILAILLLGNLHADYKFAKRENFLHSTYIIPWEQILNDIKSSFREGGYDIILYDDDSFEYYLKRENLASYGQSVINWSPIFLSQNQRIWIVFSPKDITPTHAIYNMLETFKRLGYVEVQRIRYLEENEKGRRIKEKLLGRPIFKYKKELILFEKR